MPALFKRVCQEPRGYIDEWQALNSSQANMQKRNERKVKKKKRKRCIMKHFPTSGEKNIIKSSPRSTSKTVIIIIIHKYL